MLAVLRDELASTIGFQVLNHPATSLCRYELLTKLFACGINSFGIYPLEKCPAPQRFPVFIRHESDHKGNITNLIPDQATFERVVRKIGSAGTGIWRRLVVEFQNTSNETGIYRKYSAFKIGDRILPRNVFFGRHWMIKEADLVDAEKVWEELNFIENNPHESQVRKVFDLAGIEYGRMDYAMLNGRIQVWEINTNPMLAGCSSLAKPERMAVHDHFVKKAKTALAAIDSSNGRKDYLIGPQTRIKLLSAVIRSLGMEARHQNLKTFLGQ